MGTVFRWGEMGVDGDGNVSRTPEGKMEGEKKGGEGMYESYESEPVLTGSSRWVIWSWARLEGGEGDSILLALPCWRDQCLSGGG